MDIAGFGIEKLITFVLVLTRTAAIFSVAPIFGSGQVPLQAKVVVSVGISLVFVSLSHPVLSVVDALTMVFLIVKELVVGLIIGFVVLLIFTAIQVAGEIIDIQSGFNFATMLDPVNGAQTAVAARLHYLLAGLLFFVTNAHHMMIRGLADSFALFPVGSVVLDPAICRGILGMFGMLFGIAVRIASPVLATVFLADVALVLLARAVPQANLLIVGLPLKLGAGIIGLLVTLPVLLATSKDVFGHVYDQTVMVLRTLAGLG
jgi:flagellar biosynthetic protein FliR